MANAREAGLRPSERNVVLVAGTTDLNPQQKRHFELRGLSYKFIRLDALDAGLLSAAKAVLVAEPPGRYVQAGMLPQDRIETLFNSGIMIGFVSSDPTGFALARGARDKIERLKGTSESHADKKRNESLIPTWFYIHQDFEQVLEVIRNHDPGPSIDLDTAIVDVPAGAEEVPPKHQELMRRAFHDASRIIAEKLVGGLISDGAYRVFVIQKNYGPRPMPFFFKVGKTDFDSVKGLWNNSLTKERVSYDLWAEPYIPFHLRPGLIRDRSIAGPYWSALACHFVDGAAPLEISLRNRQADGILFALFETTLRGLRAHTLNSRPEAGAVADFIEERVDAARIKTDPVMALRIPVANKLGLTMDPVALRNELIRKAKPVKAARGIYHGDLHFKNVMVRHRDAIVIDFGSMRDCGPITADPCALEASIVFGPIDCDEKVHEDWEEFVRSIYKNPLEPLAPAVDHFRFAWMARAVRELRHVAHYCGVSREENILMLAASLLRYARFPREQLKDPRAQEISETRKAFAMAMAEKLCNQV